MGVAARQGRSAVGRLGASVPEPLVQTRSEGRTGVDRRMGRERSANTFAAQPWIGYATRAGMANTEILAKGWEWRTILRSHWRGNERTVAEPDSDVREAAVLMPTSFSKCD